MAWRIGGVDYGWKSGLVVGEVHGLTLPFLNFS